MAKKKKTLKELEALAVPSADNAKWIGIGFITAVIIVGFGMVVLFHAR